MSTDQYLLQQLENVYGDQLEKKSNKSQKSRRTRSSQKSKKSQKVEEDNDNEEKISDINVNEEEKALSILGSVNKGKSQASSASTSISSYKLKPPKRDYEDVMMMKKNLLFDIDRFMVLKKYNYCQPLTLATSLEELQFVYEKFKMEAERESAEEDVRCGIESVKQKVLFAVQGLEAILTSGFVTSRLPFLRMNGFSQTLAVEFNQKNKTRMFERLYIKYRCRDFLPPEVDLFLCITMCAVMYQTMNKVFDNPELSRSACNTVNNMMNNDNLKSTFQQAGQGVANFVSNLQNNPTPKIQTENPVPKAGGPSNIDDIIASLK